MRDLLQTKFETAARYLGFNPAPDAHGVLEADDGLQLLAVMHDGSPKRMNRRATLARMRELRTSCPRIHGRRYAADYAFARRNNEEAPGAGTPRASV